MERLDDAWEILEVAAELEHFVNWPIELERRMQMNSSTCGAGPKKPPYERGSECRDQ